MALLLAMYQKMRLIREINQDTLKLARISSKKQSVQKNITRVQKHFTSLLAQLDSQAKMMQNNASIFFRNSMGLGVNDFNLDPRSYSGLNGFVVNQITQALAHGGFYKYKDENGEEVSIAAMDKDEIQKMMNEYMANGGQFKYKKDPEDETKYLQNEYENYSPEQVAAFNYAKQQGQMSLSQTQAWVSQATNDYASNVSIWLEAQKAQLEAQQDAQLEPLSYEDTMIDLEKSQLETRLEMLKAEKQSYDQLVSAEAKEAAPKFGV